MRGELQGAAGNPNSDGNEGETGSKTLSNQQWLGAAHQGHLMGDGAAWQGTIPLEFPRSGHGALRVTHLKSQLVRRLYLDLERVILVDITVG